MANVNKRQWKGPNGEAKEAWMVRYKDRSGKYRGRSFKRKKEADAFARQVEIELDKDTHVARTATVTVAHLIDSYLENCEQRHKDGRKMSLAHITTLRQQFAKHIRPELGRYKLTELDFVTVEKWGNSLAREKKLSPLTVRNIVYMLRVAIDYGIRRGWAKNNIASEVLREFKGMRQKPIRIFARPEVERLLKGLNERAPRQTERSLRMVRSFCHLATFCGLRWGEIAALKVEHVSFDASIIEVRHSLARDDQLKEPKSKAGVRNVPLPGVVAESLRAWMKEHYIENERGLIFRSAIGGPITAANFHKGHWQPLLDRTGLGPDSEGRRYHFHALRHFCASMMVQQGVPLTDAAELLGHNSYDMTLQVYAHAILATNKRIEVLEGIASELATEKAPNVIPLPTSEARATGKLVKPREKWIAIGNQ